jgi:hypothetical protein
VNTLPHMQSSPSEEWFHTARELFAHWSPNLLNFESFTRELTQFNLPLTENDILEAASMLQNFSPALFAKYVETAFISGRILNKLIFLERLQDKLVPFQKGSDVRSITSYFRDLLAICAEELYIDQSFLQSEVETIVSAIFKNDFSESQKNHLYLLNSLSSGRRLLSYNVTACLKRR